MPAFWHPSFILGLSVGLIMIQPCLIAYDFLIQASVVTVFVPFQQTLGKTHPFSLVLKCQNVWYHPPPFQYSSSLVTILKTDDEYTEI